MFSEIVICIGGFVVALAAFKFIDFDEEGFEWIKSLINLIGGAAVLGIGLLMRHFGV